MVDLKANPFYLDDEAIAWVEETKNQMTLEEKIGQLFCPVGFTTDRDVLKGMLEKNIGGMMYRPGMGAEIQDIHRFLQENTKIPLLLAANLESGGTGTAADGTNFARPMQAAACPNEEEQAYRLGYISCMEGAAVGCNWSFAPIVDIDKNFRNPITNLRTFGDDADRVLRMGSAYLRGADEAGLAVSIKHFPGDGVDERDQHLHTTTNSLSTEEWMESYGKIYRELIDQGAKTVMVGHIAQPAWAKRKNPSLTPAECHMPATLRKEIVGGLLREELRFNGLVVTDATPMLGYICAMERKQAVPTSIAIGCDTFLFNRDFDEDYRYMLEGYQSGILTDERLEEALMRILGTKAALGLHKKQKEGTLVPKPEALDILHCEKFQGWAKECADQSVTLVKNVDSVLPISPETYKRVVLFVTESEMAGQGGQLEKRLRTALEAAGFEVCQESGEAYVKDQPMNIEGFKQSCDLVIYAFNLPSASDNTAIRLFWKNGMMGSCMPWFTKEVPTIGISFANPYHLLDVPMMKTYINAYNDTEETVQAVVEKLTGKSEFFGKSPVDPFCGREDTKF